MVDDVLLAARARVLHDLAARQLDVPAAVDLVDAAMSERRWWLEQWPDGAQFVGCLLAQDVQERLFDTVVARWPQCVVCDDQEQHELRIEPELGDDPHWVCERSGTVVAALGALDPL